uniref:Uncharacterized protein n=1 Tax=Rhizophora mucronata TaxID=61149 RepID=A0A2P2QLM9_RHIMU
MVFVLGSFVVMLTAILSLRSASREKLHFKVS